MVMLITLEQAKDHLRVDTDDGDAFLIFKTHAASNAVLNYIKKNGQAYEYELDTAGDTLLDSAGDPVYALDSAGEKIPLPEVQAAVLIILGVLCSDPIAMSYIEGDDTPTLGELHMPRTAKWLLSPLRVPTHA